MERKPNEKQQRFIDEYLIDLNATQAAVRAGYSEKNAQSIGYQLLHKPPVARAIARAKAERSRRTGINADRVLMELARVAFCDPADLLNLNTAEVLADASEDDRKVIAGVKVKYVPHKSYDEDGECTVETAIEREVKLCDKLKALDMLCKHLGLYERDTAADGADSTCGVIMMPETDPPLQQDGGAEDGK